MSDNYKYKKLPDGRYIKVIDDKSENFATPAEDAQLAKDIRDLLRGPSGLDGTSGVDGKDGADGRDGRDGQTGRTGLTGPRGLDGTSGTSGTSGTDGVDGKDGEKGEQGPRGFKGDKGDRGDKGFPGLQGPAGQNGTSGIGVPSGGTSGQVLAKIDGTDYNTQWVNQTGGGGGAGTSGTSGTSGINGAAGISAGQVYYFNQSENSDVSPYKVLSVNPSTASQITTTASMTGNQQNVLVAEYITPQLGFSVIPGGTQRFHLHMLKPQSNDFIEVYASIILADSSGTPIGATISSGIEQVDWIDAVTPHEVSCDLTLTTTTIDPTNRMIVKIFANNMESSSKSLVFFTQGNQYYSFVLTSVGQVAGTSGTSGLSPTNRFYALKTISTTIGATFSLDVIWEDNYATAYVGQLWRIVDGSVNPLINYVITTLIGDLPIGPTSSTIFRVESSGTSSSTITATDGYLANGLNGASGTSGTSGSSGTSGTSSIFNGIHGAYHKTGVVGQEVTQHITSSAYTTKSPTLSGRIYLHHFIPVKDMLATNLKAYVSTTSTGSMKFAVYSDGSDGLPDQLLLSSGDISVGTTGVKNYSITSPGFTFSAGTKYYIGIHTQNTPVFTAIPAASVYPMQIGALAAAPVLTTNYWYGATYSTGLQQKASNYGTRISENAPVYAITIQV